MKRKKRGIKSKITVAIIVMGIFLSLFVGIGVFLISYTHVSAQYSRHAFASAKTARMLVNGDTVAGFLESGKNDEYLETYAALKEIKSALDITYLYVVVPEFETDSVLYIFDIFTEGNDPALVGDLGEVLLDSESAAFTMGVEAYRTGNIEERSIVSLTYYGWLVSAYVPIFASDGSVTAVMGADISMNRIIGEIVMQSLQMLFMTIAVLAILLYILRFNAGKQIVTPTMKLSEHMDCFDPDDGKLDAIELPETGDEFQTIAESFNRMVRDIRYYMENLATVTADRERIATELDVATQIQASMLPCTFPAFPGRGDFDIYAAMFPAREVGGDFYDFFLIDENTLAVVIADVSDKGIPAALFMVIAKTLIKKAALDGSSPKDVFEAVNNLLCENNDAGMFVTAFMAYIDIPSGRLTYVNAGHNPPLIKQNGHYRFMEPDPCLMLAYMEDMQYSQGEVLLKAGDMLFLYTDGVTEAADKGRRLFTGERLLETANKNSSGSAEEFISAVKKEVDIFANGADQADDITMLAFELSR
ncbi:MAG: SpoIIE family protein phosphatase [Oscillospiraceae bacterium]|nr:SpoIIE family protein phosphatase [Oscillospiraceae bacterium]